MEKLRRRLTLNERIVIETLLKENKTKSYIAKYLNRNRSTITREVNTWVKKPSDKYDADVADFFAKQDYLNKRNKDKINTYKRLKLFVYKGLLSGFSPEQIGGRIKVLYPNDPVMSISYEAIYQHIYRHRQSYLGKKLIKLLPYHHHKRRENRKFGKNRVRIKDQVNISHRPQHVELRLEVGHWEGDLMIGIGQKSAIGTIVERKTRFTFIIKLENRKSETVTQQFAKYLNSLPKYILKSMTYDNGMEMANHKWLANNTGMDIFFANPYSSWERGTNENTNGLIRRFFPKGTDFNKITIEQLKQAQYSLNNRPRKILAYKTPNEIMNQEITNYAA
ncbi:IS30 family transposase [Flavobacterium sp.]|uniref:IS30 family transposase n=1 Tax=Flavobacterium sp. TaxID=239 RepID=UPI00374FDE0B